MTPEQDILPTGVLRLLSSAFDISEADVTADLTQLTSWARPHDDLLVDIERRYGWPAKTAARYLRTFGFLMVKRLKTTPLLTLHEAILEPPAFPEHLTREQRDACTDVPALCHDL